MKLATDLMIAIILVGFISAAYFFPTFPDMVPSHWNASGQVDGYMPKAWALFMMPAISVIMLLLFIAIPRIDPMKENIKKFMAYYRALVVLIMMFLLYIHFLMIVWTLGVTFNMNQAISPAMAVLFYFIGVLMAKTKKNWFVGIRTPWTLSSTKVWNKTHQRGSALFKASGIIALLGLVIPDYAVIFLIVPVIASAIYLFAYSYFEYQK
ncbi:MAG: DUF1648 domain-containing protein [Candidatus Aenigmatarchaeota archaeon]